MCERSEENIEHFVSCTIYECETLETDWKQKFNKKKKIKTFSIKESLKEKTNKLTAKELD